MEVGKVFIIVDALDECEQIINLLPIFERVARCTPLFITSRDDQDIRRSFTKYLKYQIPILPETIYSEI